MIQANSNLSPLAFYWSIDEQQRRRTYAYGDGCPLYVPLGCVPPFQILIPHNTSRTVSGWYLHRADGTQKASIGGQLSAHGLRRVDNAGGDVYLYPCLAPHNITTEEGQYYLRVAFNDGTTAYSDVFTVTGITGGLLRLQWWDEQDIVMDGGRVVYRYNGEAVYRNTLWLATQLGKPDYEFEDEGEDRDGLYFPEKMVSYKRYRFQFLADEPTCDVLRLVSLADHVVITDQWGEDYECDTFQSTPKWEVQGNVASVEAEFTCDTVAKKVAQGFEGLGTLGDYDGSYNDDFEVTEN